MRKPKQPPEVSPQVWRLYAFVKAVRDGTIAAAPNSSAPTDLRAVADMLDEILHGADPTDVFALCDRRAPGVPFAAYYRDQVLACAVREERATTPNIETAIANIAQRSGRTESIVRDAYYEHNVHAGSVLRLKQLGFASDHETSPSQGGANESVATGLGFDRVHGRSE